MEAARPPPGVNATRREAYSARCRRSPLGRRRGGPRGRGGANASKASPRGSTMSPRHEKRAKRKRPQRFSMRRFDEDCAPAYLYHTKHRINSHDTLKAARTHFSLTRTARTAPKSRDCCEHLSRLAAARRLAGRSGRPRGRPAPGSVGHGWIPVGLRERRLPTHRSSGRAGNNARNLRDRGCDLSFIDP